MCGFIFEIKKKQNKKSNTFRLCNWKIYCLFENREKLNKERRKVKKKTQRETYQTFSKQGTQIKSKKKWNKVKSVKAST